ncbi:sigma-70 family RNA polymerase sigma factor [Siminovitchia terrae]|nr:sigma-70 family RNA polymerase sigma factor [Siminovitchia terrae]GIN91879.1 DNA-directed RNA polymerase sigma-70 factor [Siminovitchia terrae]
MIILQNEKLNSSINREVFFSLFQEYQEDMFRMAYAYVKNSNDALDVVQEVAYRSLKKIDTLKETKYFKTWLLKITINCSLDWLRKKNKVAIQNIDLENYQNSSVKHVDLPLKISLEDILNRLETTEKTVILLKYYQEYTFQEISLMMSLPLSTVKSITYRALRKFEKNIKKEDVYGG